MSKKHKGQTLTIKDKTYPVVHTFPIMHVGWEGDNQGYVVLDDGKHRMATTNHGTPCFMSESNIEYVQSQLKEAQDGLNTALALCK